MERGIVPPRRTAPNELSQGQDISPPRSPLALFEVTAVRSLRSAMMAGKCGKMVSIVC
jgi:hypothetical protein